jgi:hypothetical protein
MKKIILLFLFLLPLFGKSQAHLGATLQQIKEMYPNKTFETGKTNDGTFYAMTGMSLGVFCYYFDADGITYMCVQFPDDMKALNTQVEIYNKKYVIVSETEWKAYLEGGGRLTITLEYNKAKDLYLFRYE